MPKKKAPKTVGQKPKPPVEDHEPKLVADLYAAELGELSSVLDACGQLIEIYESFPKDAYDLRRVAISVESGARQAMAAASRALQIAEGIRAISIARSARL